MASLLLIGGTGFFGKSFLDSFQRGGLEDWGIDRIIAMSRHADQLKVAAPQLLNSNVELINADIGTVGVLPAADFVIHAAASTDARNYLSRPLEERKNIQAGVYNYCRLAKKFHSNSKIVYVSSGAAYGVQPPEMAFLSEDFVSCNLEQMPEHKKNYAIAKRESERAIEQLCRTEGLSANIARCFAFVGPWLPRNQHFAIGNFIEDGLRGNQINVKATHPVYRSYMYADDLVDWLMAIAKSASDNCEIFNVGSDEPVSMVKLAELVAEQLEVSVSVASQTKEDTVDRYIPSTSKAKKRLGLYQKVGLKEAVNKTIENVRAKNYKKP